jgi:hypothetical protein
MAESEPVAELAPQFSSDDATATPWAVARERLAEADTYWLATLDEVGKAAAFMASDGAGPMTATFANITCDARSSTSG